MFTFAESVAVFGPCAENLHLRMLLCIFREVPDQRLNRPLVGITDLTGGKTFPLAVHGKPFGMFLEIGNRKEVTPGMLADIQNHAAFPELRQKFPLHLPPFNLPAVIAFLCAANRSHQQVETVPPEPADDPAQILPVFRVDRKNADSPQFKIGIDGSRFRHGQMFPVRKDRLFLIEKPAASPEFQQFIHSVQHSARKIRRNMNPVLRHGDAESVEAELRIFSVQRFQFDGNSAVRFSSRNRHGNSRHPGNAAPQLLRREMFHVPGGGSENNANLRRIQFLSPPHFSAAGSIMTDTDSMTALDSPI